MMIKAITHTLLMLFSCTLAAESRSHLVTFVNKHCVDCHDEDISKGDVRFDIDFSKNEALLEKAFLQVRSKDMPPPKKSKLSDNERTQLITELAKAVHHKNSPKIKRLTKLELISSLEDIFDIKIQPHWIVSIPEDSGKGEFNTVGNLGFSENHLREFISVIDTVVDKALASEKPAPKKHISSKFIYERHPKRPKININKPKTVIKAQPHTANGLSFPYFRDDFICENEGYYKISFKALSKEGSDLLIYADKYHQDGALVNNEPRLVSTSYISGESHQEFTAYLKKGNQLAFAVLKGQEVSIWNPVIINGPQTAEWPHSRLSKLFPNVKVESSDNSFKLAQISHEEIKRVIINFATLAFREKVTEAEIKSFLQIAIDSYAENKELLPAFKESFKAILSSPRFLYRNSVKDNYATAEKISYLLWRSTPDKELLAAAYDKNLDSQIQRVIDSPKTKRFIDDFTHQWLDLKHIYKTAPDFRLYPEYDSFLNFCYDQEPKSFMKYLYDKDLPLKNIIDSDFLMINSRLARLYNISNVTGPEFRAINKPKDSIRGGLITQAAIMVATADGASTTPVKRGVWLSERILGKTIPMPPKEVPGIEPDLSKSTTILEKLAAHRSNKACRSCHTRIDPYGVAFEVFDPIGQLRVTYRVLKKNARQVITYNPDKGQYINGADVVTDYQMADGRSVNDVKELKNALREDFEMVHRSFVQKIYEFSLGKELSPEEILISDKFSKKHHNSGFKSLMKALIQSDLFRGEI